MAKTARQIVSSALRKVGVLASGESLNASELQDGLSGLQGMIDSWSTNDLLAFSETQETFAFTPDKQEYTIGVGGDFDTSRPMEIFGISVVQPDGIELPVNLLKFDQWRELGLKTTKSTFPTEAYYRTEWPMARLFFYPVPTLAYSLIIYSRKPFAEITGADAVIDLPPGYEDAITNNLAIELAEEFGGTISQFLMKKADDGLSAIKAQNLSKKIPYAVTDSSLRGERQRSGWLLSDFLKGGS